MTPARAVVGPRPGGGGGDEEGLAALVGAEAVGRVAVELDAGLVEEVLQGSGLDLGDELGEGEVDVGDGPHADPRLGPRVKSVQKRARGTVCYN